MQNGSISSEKMGVRDGLHVKKGQIFGAGLHFVLVGPWWRLAPDGGPKAPTQSNVRRSRGRET